MVYDVLECSLEVVLGKLMVYDVLKCSLEVVLMALYLEVSGKFMVHNVLKCSLGVSSKVALYLRIEGTSP